MTYNTNVPHWNLDLEHSKCGRRFCHLFSHIRHIFSPGPPHSAKSDCCVMRYANHDEKNGTPSTYQECEKNIQPTTFAGKGFMVSASSLWQYATHVATAVSVACWKGFFGAWIFEHIQFTTPGGVIGSMKK